MTLKQSTLERLQILAETLPPDGSVTFSRTDLHRMLGMIPEEEGDAGLKDLTVEELAEELDRSPSTVRGWAPTIDGAYRLGREWRFPRAAVRRWLDEKRDEPAERQKEEGPVNLGTWKKHLRRTP